MEKEVLIVKNISREGPGLLYDVLQEKAIKSTLVDLDKGEVFPEVSKYSAVFVLGGSDSANDETEKMQNELRRIDEIIDKQIPYLGICLGLQTLVKAGSGQVIKNSIKEIGFRDPENNRFQVELTEDGRRDRLFNGLGAVFDVFHLHGETVILTDEMKLLGTGKFCRNQIVKVGKNSYGLQCHFELTTEMFEIWLAQDPDLAKLDEAELRKDFEANKEDYTKVGNQLFTNFLEIAGF